MVQKSRKTHGGTNNGAMVKQTVINVMAQNRGSRFNALNEESSAVIKHNDDNGNKGSKKGNILNQPCNLEEEKEARDNSKGHIGKRQMENKGDK